MQDLESFCVIQYILMANVRMCYSNPGNVWKEQRTYIYIYSIANDHLDKSIEFYKFNYQQSNDIITVTPWVSTLIDSNHSW